MPKSPEQIDVTPPEALGVRLRQHLDDEADQIRAEAEAIDGRLAEDPAAVEDAHLREEAARLQGRIIGFSSTRAILEAHEIGAVGAFTPEVIIGPQPSDPTSEEQ